MLVGLVAGYVKMQTRLDETAKKVDVLYQRALWHDSGRAGPPEVPLTEEN